jgi:hypothetical protein
MKNGASAGCSGRHAGLDKPAPYLILGHPEIPGAVITPMYNLAREMASGPIPEGPFAEVPFLMKDIGAY